jgi:osmotically-inducible protein OsmY
LKVSINQNLIEIENLSANSISVQVFGNEVTVPAFNTQTIAF